MSLYLLRLVVRRIEQGAGQQRDDGEEPSFPTECPHEWSTSEARPVPSVSSCHF